MEAAVLDVEGEGIELVVGIDDRLRALQVPSEQHVCDPRDAFGDMGGQADDVALDVVELVVEGLADLRHRSTYTFI